MDSKEGSISQSITRSSSASSSDLTTSSGTVPDVKERKVEKASLYTSSKQGLLRFYENLYNKIIRKKKIGTFEIEDIFRHFAFDEEGMPLATASFISPFITNKNKLLIQDLSGIGFNLFGYYLAYEILKNESCLYDAVIVVPALQIHKFFKENFPKTAEELINALYKKYTNNTLAEISLDRVLIIIDALDVSQLGRWRSEEEKVPGKRPNIFDSIKLLKMLCEHTVETIIVISNESSVYEFSQNDTLKLVLKPFYVNISLEKNEQESKSNSSCNTSTQFVSRQSSRNSAEKLRLSSSDILNIAQEALEFVFRIDDSKTAPGTKNIISFSGIQNQIIQDRPVAVDGSRVTVPHSFQVLSSDELCHFILGESLSKDLTERFYTLKNPAEWFAAAVTTPKTAPRGKAYYAYHINGRLFIRNAQDHYISDIGDLKQVRTDLAERRKKDEQFSFLTRENLKTVLEKGKGSFRIDLKKRLKEPAISMIVSKKAQLEKSLQDTKVIPEVTKDSKESKKLIDRPTYTRLQKGLINEFFSEDKMTSKRTQAHVKPSKIEINKRLTELAHELLCGKKIEAPDFFVSLIAALIISETCRYHPAFISMLTFLDLTESQAEFYSWEYLLWHPDAVDKRKEKMETLEEAIVLDFLDNIGGIHPMASRGSYRQTEAQMQPRHGLRWIDFKSALLLTNWVIQNFKDFPSYFISPSLIGLRDQSIDKDNELFNKEKSLLFDLFFKRLIEFNRFLPYTVRLEKLPLFPSGSYEVISYGVVEDKGYIPPQEKPKNKRYLPYILTSPIEPLYNLYEAAKRKNYNLALECLNVLLQKHPVLSLYSKFSSYLKYESKLLQYALKYYLPKSNDEDILQLRSAIIKRLQDALKCRISYRKTNRQVHNLLLHNGLFNTNAARKESYARAIASNRNEYRKGIK